ncbi:MAG: PadR family transcriptional regulator [Acidimicrobiia bacterium]
MSTPNLTTTSYAILGLLAVRPFGTYEIAKQMDRALGQFWPRARSKIYEEPKKLVALGLARATPEEVGGRRRTVYSITAKGRTTLGKWVRATSDAGPAIEFESLMKVFYAEHGSKADLLTTVCAVREWSDNETLATGYVADEYLDNAGPFPERLPWLILVGHFLDGFLEFVADWADWAEAIVESWPDDITQANPDLETLRRHSERMHQVAERVRATTSPVR